MVRSGKREKERARKSKKANETIARAILEAYKPETVAEMQEALKDVFGPMFEAMLQGELNAHLGYENNVRGEKNTENRRNGYGKKTVTTTAGALDISVPQDRDGSFAPRLISKRQRDVSGIENKVLSMYAKGMSQRDIATTIEEIYGFEISHEAVSTITDQALEQQKQWQNRPLKKIYLFVFVDCLYVTLHKDYEAKECAVYVILGCDTDGKKDILGLRLNEAKSKHHWMQIFDELKKRGVEDVITCP